MWNFLAITFIQALFVTSSIASRDVDLVAPSVVRALSYDVTVVVVRPYKGLIVELYYGDDSVPLTGQIIARIEQNDEAGLVFNCGYFSQLGNYHLKIFDEAKQKNLNVSKVIEVREWPEISLSSKPFHDAYTTDVQVEIHTADDICNSYVSKQFKTKLQIVNKINGEIQTETSSNFPPSSHIFQCHSFTNQGSYIAQLSSIDDVIIARSDVINVKWSDEYQLNVKEKLLPCKRGIKIKVETPPCYSHYDVIQAALLDDNGNYQVLQNITLGTKGHVLFPCSVLPSSSPSVCFRYLTSSGFVVRTVCRVVDKTKELRINGGWSVWASWEKCSRKCNYLTTRRARVCNNPLARGVGRSCNSDGSLYSYEFFEDKHKPREVCPFLFGTPGNVTTPNCECGCYIHADSNNYLSSPVPGQCKEKNQIEWKLYTSKGSVLKLHIIDLQLGYGEYLTVIDGHGSTISMTSQGQLMTSQSNVVNIQYTRINVVEPFQSCGFVIEYSVQDKNKTIFMTSQPPTTDVIITDNADWLRETMANPVTMGAIGACLLVICIVSIVAVLRCKRQCKNKRRHNELIVRRLTTPPDGKSCSNFDGESDRQSPVGENTGCNLDVTVKPRTEYYLAQRQLQLMKKLGKENLQQTYDSSCINKTIVKEQEELLFGDLNNAHSQAL